MQVWDMASGSCVQTLEGAHSSTILDMLAWEVWPLPPVSHVTSL